MADAIPVHSEPKRQAPKIKVDHNGVPMPDDYVLQVRDNLGDPKLFQGSTAKVREMTSSIDRPDGSQYVHTYTRTDW
jgi:hypothetical protein